MKLVVIGASTGGVELLSWLVSQLPANLKYPILIVQHIPTDMPDSYINTIAKGSRVSVKEAYHLEHIKPGTVYFAPADYHLMVESKDLLALSVDDKVNYARPSIDVLFYSAAEVYKQNCVGIVLTGANSDGAAGALAIQEYGGEVLVQDPKTAQIGVMPKAVKEKLDLPTDKCLTPQQIADYLANLNKM